MKLPYLIIIFIIIIIPVIFIFSYYLGLELDTINLQTSYDQKLIEATKEGIEAFEINTLEWNNEYSSLANSKRRDIQASINVFTTGLANKLGIGGTAKEYILDYVPAIVYIMYDGYYIYTPTYIPQNKTNDDGLQYFYYKVGSYEGISENPVQQIGGDMVQGEIMYEAEKNPKTLNGITFTTNIQDAKKTYKHLLKTFVPYSTVYGNYVINYTLDNYIRIIGEDVSKEGYVLNSGDKIEVTTINGKKFIKFNSKIILPEELEENIAIRDNAEDDIEIKSYQYVYNSNNEKRYYDGSRFFIVNNNYVKIYLPEVEANQQVAEYKKVLYLVSASNQEYIELYQLLNKNDGKIYQLDENNQYVEVDVDNNIEEGYSINFSDDYSAINYYIETCCFNNWLRGRISNTNDLMENKRGSIIENINNNLNLSMANYSAHSSLKYRLPVITEADWTQALSNISIITFFQGAKIGLKTYNNYVVATSSQNNEFIGDDSLYYYDDTLGDSYYHSFGCVEGKDSVNSAYLNIDFLVQSYQDGEDTFRYYKHCTLANPLSQCFSCIVNLNKKTEASDLSKYTQLKDLALARERYIKNSRTKLFSNY